MNQTGVADYDLNPGPQLTLIPRFPFFRRHLGREHGYPDPFFRQDALQPTRHVTLLRVDRVDLHLPAKRKRGFDFLHQPSLLGIDKVLIQVGRGCDQKWLTTLGFWIELTADQVSEAVGSIWKGKEGIQGDAGNRRVTSMLTESLFDVSFHLLVSLLQRLVHLHADNFLPVGRESIGNIFQRYERTETHQEATKQQG